MRTMILAVALPVAAKDAAGLDGKVVAVGHVSNDAGKRIPTATIVLYDPAISVASQSPDAVSAYSSVRAVNQVRKSEGS